METTEMDSCIVDVDWLKVCVQLVVRGEMETTEMDSCIVDVDWLKVCVQLVVRGRDGDYRDEQLYCIC
jgi:hypothetical protein